MELIIIILTCGCLLFLTIWIYANQRAHLKEKNRQTKQFPDNPPFVTMGWDGYPTIVNTDGTIFTRAAEIIFHAKYYKDNDYKNWPTDPQTGNKLEIKPMKL